MNKEQVYELNDLLAAFMDRHAIAYDDDSLDDAVHAVVSVIERED